MQSSAQETVNVAPAPSARFPAAWYPPDNDVTTTMPPVTGAPYMAHAVLRSEVSAASVGESTLQARDSAGRTRTERAMGPRLAQNGAQLEVRRVEVDDPVSHCSFYWMEPWIDKSAPTATVQCMPRTVHYNGKALWLSVVSMHGGEEHPFPQVTDETTALGERTFDGVRAIGFLRVRTHDTTPPQTVETEVWSAPTMKEIVSISVKGAMGYSVELHDIQLREPDAKLFYPPDGYKIEVTPSHP